MKKILIILNNLYNKVTQLIVIKNNNILNYVLILGFLIIFVYSFLFYYDSNIFLYIRYLGYSLISFTIFYFMYSKFNYSKNNIIKVFQNILMCIICFLLSIILCSLINLFYFDSTFSVAIDAINITGNNIIVNTDLNKLMIEFKFSLSKEPVYISISLVEQGVNSGMDFLLAAIVGGFGASCFFEDNTLSLRDRIIGALFSAVLINDCYLLAVSTSDIITSYLG